MRHRLGILILFITAFCLPTVARQDSIKNRLVLDDGSVYTGQMKLRKPYGTGRTDHVNGDVYEGAYEKGQRKGVGICHYANGDLYLGFWDNNVRSGEGELQYASGDVYKGNWKDGERRGKGVYLWADGSYYSGEWEGNARQGTGQMCWQDSSEYRGSWHDGQREGQGEYKSRTYSYAGSWKNDRENGNGICTMPNGDKYQGQFRDGMISGNGEYTFANGDTYKGHAELQRNAAFLHKLLRGDLLEHALVRNAVVRGNLAELIEQMAGDHEGHALLIHLNDKIPYLLDARGIEAVYRFIEHEKLGVSQKCDGNAEALAHTEREFLCLLFAGVVQPDKLQQFLYAVK